MTVALEGVSGQQHAPAALNPGEGPGTHFKGGWVGLRASLDGRKILPPPGFDPGSSTHSQSLYQLSYPVHIPEEYESTKLQVKCHFSDCKTFFFLKTLCTDFLSGKVSR